jgi:hypothetical protein
LEVVLDEPAGDVGAELGALDVCCPEVDALVHAGVDGVVDDVGEGLVAARHLGAVGGDPDDVEGDRFPPKKASAACIIALVTQL